jgi:uroporphyrinogen III methyltransferase / synthase
MADAERPLAGQTVVVTRSRSQATKLADSLEELGARVLEFPCIEIHTTASPLDIDPMAFDWLVFVSTNAVRSLHEKMNEAALPFTFGGAQIAAVGPATQETLESLGVQVESIPETFTAENAFEALRQREPDLNGKRVLLPQGSLANPTLRDALVNAGANVTAPVVYETTCPAPDESRADALVDARPGWITFTSGSTARHFARLMGSERLTRLTECTRYASIGPQTTAEAKAAGLPVDVEAERHDIPRLVEALVAYSANEEGTHE